VDCNEEFINVDTSGDLANVNVLKVGGTTQTAADLYTQQLRILDRIDYQRGHHTVVGSTFYVDGLNGNDSNAGTRAAPRKTISSALALCTANAHDEIILLPVTGGGPTTITESATITITKAYVQIRGPGRDGNVTRSNNGGIFDIQASGVELSGFRITTFGGASSDAVTVSAAADFVRLYRLWIVSAHRDAIQFNVANNCEVLDCLISTPARDGVRVTSGSGSGMYISVQDCVIRDAVGSAVNLQGSDASECIIQNNVIRDNATGITIASGVVDTVFTDNRLINNTTQISDSGTRTQEEWNWLDTGSDGRVNVGSWLGQTVQAAVNGFPKVDLTYILGTILSETSGGLLAAAFKKFFDKATPTGTINSLPDAVPGASGGLLKDDVWTDARGALLDNLDAAISTRMATFTLPTNFSSLSIDASGRMDLAKWLGTAPLALSSQLVQSIVADYAANKSPNIKKNTALSNFEFLMVDSTDHFTPKTGLTITATRSIDGAAFAATTNSSTEIASGWYKINMSAADLNGDVVSFSFAGAGADTRTFTIKTVT
jgi:hypothetical protein